MLAIAEARLDPKSVSRRLSTRVPRFTGRDYADPQRKSTIVKKEGAAAVNEAIRVCNAQTALPFSTAQVPEGMCLAAEDHCRDIGASGSVDHSGRDGSSPSARLERYGRWLGATGECIWFGKLFSNEARDAQTLQAQARSIVDDLIIDDGVPGRGHRACVFDDRFALGGAFVGRHAIFSSVVMIEFVGGWQEGREGRLANRLARLALLDTFQAPLLLALWEGLVTRSGRASWGSVQCAADQSSEAQWSQLLSWEGGSMSGALCAGATDGTERGRKGKTELLLIAARRCLDMGRWRHPRGEG